MTEDTIVNISGASVRDRLRAEAAQKYAPESFTPPDSDIPLTVRRLKGIESDELYNFLTAETDISQTRYDAKTVSLGLVDPVLTFEEALEMPSAWLRAVAAKIVAKGEPPKAEDAKKDGASPVPFISLNSSITDLDSSSTKPSSKSKP